MTSGKFHNMTLVFTGMMSGSFVDVVRRAQKEGAVVADHVTENTDWVVMGQRPCQEILGTANELCVRVITEYDYEQSLSKERAAAAARPESDDTTTALKWLKGVSVKGIAF